MGIFGPDEVITSYSIKQAVEDGVLVEVFKNRWGQLSGGKPIVATASVFEGVSMAGLIEIWNGYVVWKRDVMPTLPEEKRLFSTKMNQMMVWAIEDAVAITLMYPEDY